MKVVIFTQNTMASIVATRRILHKNSNKVKAIVLASQIKGDSFWAQIKIARKLIQKSSLSFFIYKVIESKLYNVLLSAHKLLGTRKYKNGRAATIEDLAIRYNIPIIHSTNLSDEIFLHKINALQPDYVLCLVAQILRKKVFTILGDKLINAHGSYLPEYRGAAQYIFYLANKDLQYGVTIHYMEPGLDTGDIIFQRKFHIPKKWSVYDLHYAISASFGDMLNEFLEMNDFTRTSQDHSKATETRMPTKEDMKQVRVNGRKIMRIRDFFTHI